MSARFERALRVAQVSAVDREASRQHAVVERRDEHLDLVRADDPDAVQQMLLRQVRGDDGTLRARAGELVDELVDPGRTDGAGRTADDELPTGELHQTSGLISTSDASSCFRYRTTWSNVSGGATCSDSV